VCKDYEKGVVHLSKKDQVKWEEYASRHGVDVKRDVRRDRARMAINWLRPFLGLTPSDYKILCKKCVAKVDGIWRKQTMFFNAVASKVSSDFEQANKM
jgi:hypothetical protein